MTARYFSIFIILFSTIAQAQNCDWVNNSFQVGNIYYKNRNYLLSLTTLSPLIANKCSVDIAKKSYLYSLRSAYELKDMHLLNNLLVEFDGASIYKAFFLNGDFELNEEEKLKIQIWNSRKNKDELGTLKQKTKILSEDLVLEYEKMDLKKKSPLTAGLLSALVPGAGHIYVGAYQSGAISLFLNLLLGFAVYELYDEDLDATASVGALGFSVIYVGNIISSVKSAQAHNNSLYYEPDEKLKRVLFPEIFSF